MSKYFDEFEIGEMHKTRSMSLSEGQIMDFAMMYDPQHMHIDHQKSKEGPFGGIIASGFQTMCIAFRLFYDLDMITETSIIGLGYDKIRWKKPLYPAESIYVTCRVIDMKASSSKPDRGILTWEFLTYNSEDELVMSNEATMMIKRKIS